jgi:hypothetical protein
VQAGAGDGFDRLTWLDIIEIVLDVDHFHNGELLTLALFYEIVEAVGGKCPTIKAEIIRKSTTV